MPRWLSLLAQFDTMNSQIFYHLSAQRSVRQSTYQKKLFLFTNASTCRSIFGKTYKNQNELVMLIQRAVSLSRGFELADLYPSKTFLHGISGMKSKLMKARTKVDMLLDNMINVHRENRANGKNCNGESVTEDLIDVFLRVMESGEFQFPLTNDNIKAIILVSFIFRYNCFPFSLWSI